MSDGTLIDNGQTISLQGNLTLTNGSLTATGLFQLTGTNQTIVGSPSFYQLTKTVSTADTLTFSAGETVTVANQLTLQGASRTALLALRSSSSGTQWQFNVQDGYTVSFLDVQDSSNTGKKIKCLTSQGCVDRGNNTNWQFKESGGRSNSLFKRRPRVISQANFNFLPDLNSQSSFPPNQVPQIKPHDPFILQLSLLVDNEVLVVKQRTFKLQFSPDCQVNNYQDITMDSSPLKLAPAQRPAVDETPLKSAWPSLTDNDLPLPDNIPYPVFPQTTIAASPQRQVLHQGISTFTNSLHPIYPRRSALWQFFLEGDDNLINQQSYCFRIVYADDNSLLENYLDTPKIKAVNPQQQNKEEEEEEEIPQNQQINNSSSFQSSLKQSINILSSFLLRWIKEEQQQKKNKETTIQQQINQEQQEIKQIKQRIKEKEQQQEEEEKQKEQEKNREKQQQSLSLAEKQRNQEIQEIQEKPNNQQIQEQPRFQENKEENQSSSSSFSPVSYLASMIRLIFFKPLEILFSWLGRWW